MSYLTVGTTTVSGLGDRARNGKLFIELTVGDASLIIDGTHGTFDGRPISVMGRGQTYHVKYETPYAAKGVGVVRLYLTEPPGARDVPQNQPITGLANASKAYRALDGKQATVQGNTTGIITVTAKKYSPCSLCTTSEEGQTTITGRTITEPKVPLYNIPSEPTGDEENPPWEMPPQVTMPIPTLTPTIEHLNGAHDLIRQRTAKINAEPDFHDPHRGAFLEVGDEPVSPAKPIW